MPPIKQRPPASVAVSKANIEQATLTLQELPAKTKDTWSLREAVTLLQDSITTALDRGYSYEEVSTMLAGKGVAITPSSLKRYLANAKKQNEGGAKASTGKRGRTPRAPKTEAATDAEASTDATDAAPTKRRGRGPNKAKGEGEETKPKATRSAAARKNTAASGTTKVAASEKQPKAARTTSTRGRKKASSAE
jgi:hypothetical protein